MSKIEETMKNKIISLLNNIFLNLPVILGNLATFVYEIER